MSYDEDYQDPRQRCKHGTFIGSWWGPDYLCMDCEMGTSDYEYVIGKAHEVLWRAQSQFGEQWDWLTDETFDRMMSNLPDRYKWTLVNLRVWVIMKDHEYITNQLRRIRRAKLRLRVLECRPASHECFNLTKEVSNG